MSDDLDPKRKAELCQLLEKQHEEMLVEQAEALVPRLQRLIEDVQRAVDDYKASREKGETQSSFGTPLESRLVSTIQHEVLVTLPNLGLDTLTDYACTVLKYRGQMVK